jgi:hypothetical protein
VATAGGKPAQIHFAWQMRDQEGGNRKVKKAGMQQEVTAIRHGLADGPLQPPSSWT